MTTGEKIQRYLIRIRDDERQLEFVLQVQVAVYTDPSEQPPIDVLQCLCMVVNVNTGPVVVSSVVEAHRQGRVGLWCLDRYKSKIIEAIREGLAKVTA